MKIILINGSPRKTGTTGKILANMNTILSSYNEVETELVHISDLDFKYCVGCSNCYKTGDCFLKDDAEELSQKLSNADGVIIGTPIYASNVSGQLKAFIDRGHFVVEQLLHGKQAIPVVTFENAGGAETMKILRTLLLFSGAAIRGKLLFKVSNEVEIEKDKALEIHTKKLCRKLYNSIVKNEKPAFFQRLVQFFVFNVGLKPFVLKKGAKYQGVLRRWEDIGIWRQL
jgi:multimeric flavodoxin WrbA